MRKLIPAALLVAFVAGCGMSPAAKAPVRAAGKAQAASQAADSRFLHISYITANGQMGTSFDAPPNLYVRFRAYTSAPYNAQLDWTWRAFGGFMNGFNDQATWTTPSFDGTYTVDVQVRDRQSGWDWKTLYFRIKRDATEFTATTLSDAEKAKAQGPRSTGVEAKPL